MKLSLYLITCLVCLQQISIAQLENVKVETYYISDSSDATDTVGGHLVEGSLTYRIYIDLESGSRLLSVYGDEHHPLKFSSTTTFFNHVEEGITFGKDFNRNRFSTGTAPLDTYLTLGQCSKSFSQTAYYGIPKEDDIDGSIVGGVNNDGGSSSVPGGLLINHQAGIELSVADGMAIKGDLPDSWIDVGFKDVLADADTTIFGLSNKEIFFSNSAQLRNSGVKGVDTLQNEILIAQLTTKGDIRFELNLEVEEIKDGTTQIIKYVAQNIDLAQDEMYSPLLSYPFICGCTDPDYLEASTSFACSDNSKCLTRVVLGCTDSLACNYDVKANLNVGDLCCYIGFCHDLDISVICPDLQPRYLIDDESITIFPNPATTELNVEMDFVRTNDTRFLIRDLYGNEIRFGVLAGNHPIIGINELPAGYFLLELMFDDRQVIKPFIKL